MTFRIVVPDNVDSVGIDILRNEEQFDVLAPGKMTREECLAAVPDADVLIVRSSTQVDEEMLTAAPHLKIVARAGAGVDNIDVDTATRRGVVVMNTPGGNTISTAELAFGLLISLARHIPFAHASMGNGAWDRKLFSGVELQGKTLGCVGFGRVGQAVSQRAKAFAMDVLAFDPFMNEGLTAIARDLEVEVVSLDELYHRSDFITLHATLTEQTRGMINKNSLSLMKPGMKLINTARGGLVNEADLAEAIKSGVVSGAAVDVYSQEPPQADNALLSLPGVIYTPHLAASTIDAQLRVSEMAAQQVVDALLKYEYRHVVNTEVLARAK